MTKQPVKKSDKTSPHYPAVSQPHPKPSHSVFSQSPQRMFITSHIIPTPTQRYPKCPTLSYPSSIQSSVS